MCIRDSSSGGHWQLEGEDRPASSIARSVERKGLEEQALAEALSEQVEKWQTKSDWTKLKCIEMLIVRGKSNKQTAELLGLTEQQVANYKFDFLARLRTLIKKQELTQEVFPELYEQ